jgi:hypothetical protein
MASWNGNWKLEKMRSEGKGMRNEGGKAYSEMVGAMRKKDE